VVAERQRRALMKELLAHPSLYLAKKMKFLIEESVETDTVNSGD
jgi:hypothetical protein